MLFILIKYFMYNMGVVLYILVDGDLLNKVLLLGLAYLGGGHLGYGKVDDLPKVNIHGV